MSFGAYSKFHNILSVPQPPRLAPWGFHSFLLAHQLRHPYISLDYDVIIEELNNAFLLKAKATGLELKGQMMPVPLTHYLHSDTGTAPAAAAAAPISTSGCPFAAMAAAAATSSSSAAGDNAEQGMDGLLFLGTARLAGLDDMRDQRLFLSDIPLHDLNRDFVLLAEQRHAEAQLKERFEALTLELKVVWSG